MLKNDFLEWRSENKKIDNEDAFNNFESKFNLKLPEAYKNIVRFRDGGFLKRNLFFYDHEGNHWRNCICDFLCWQKETLEDDYILDRIQDPPEFFPNGLIPFAPDGGGSYICFNYRNCNENPPIVFWHHGVEENEGIFHLAGSFEEFINNLKSEDELDD